MLDSLDLLQKKITQNINNLKAHCNGCPLAINHSGPVFIKHEGKSSPKMVIISESPAKFEDIEYDFSKVDQWTTIILKEIKSFSKYTEIKDVAKVTKLGDFLAFLTDTRIVSNPEKQTTINNIYWTHAVKCFIQQKNESLNSAKKRLGNKFNKASKCCCEYIKEELEIIKPDLILAIGDVAFNAIVPNKIIGKPIKFPSIEVVYTYHPNSRKKAIVKEEGFKYAKERIMNYL